MAFMCADSGNLMAIAQQVLIQQQQQQQPPPFQWQPAAAAAAYQDPFPQPAEYASDDWMHTLIAGASPPPPLFADSDLDRIVFSHPSPPPPPRMPSLPELPRRRDPAPASPLLRSLLETAAVAGDFAGIRAAASPDGDPAQRVAFHFLNALLSPPPPSSSPAPADALCYKLLDDWCPYSKFAHLTANQAILDATAGASVIHVVDIGIVHGVQWAALLQALATRPEGKPALVRLSGVPSPSAASHSLAATAARLAEFAEFLDLQFEFTPVHELHSSDFPVKSGETVVVNFMLQLHHWLSGEPGEPGVHRILRLAKSLSPAIITLAEHEVGLNQCGFADRVHNSMSYFYAVFESVDAAVDRSSGDRARAERRVLGERIREAVGDDGRRVRMAESGEWKAVMEAAGLMPVKLSNFAVSQAELLLWNYDYSLKYSLVKEPEPPEELSIAWAGRRVITVSAWH